MPERSGITGRENLFQQVRRLENSGPFQFFFFAAAALFVCLVIYYFASNSDSSPVAVPITDAHADKTTVAENTERVTKHANSAVSTSPVEVANSHQPVIPPVKASTPGPPAPQADTSAAPQQPVLTAHQQRLADLREKQEAAAMSILIEHETIDRIVREDGMQGVPQDENERVKRLVQEKESIDAAIKEAERLGGPEPPPPTLLQTLPHHQMGEMFSVGYWTYRCDAVRWSELLGDGSSGMGHPDAAFAVISLMMRNDDDSESILPDLKLLDSDAREYQPSPKAVLQRDALTSGSLPGKASRSGTVIFDVPQGRTYYLKVSGGFWSNKDAIIDLTTQ